VIPTPPVATTGPGQNVTASTATLTGTVNPNGADTSWHFDYGTNTGYGNSTAAQDLPAASPDNGPPDRPVSAPLSGLQANTTYHYRLVAVSANGTATGTDQAFTTQGFPATDEGAGAPTATCAQSTVRFGPISAIASCFHEQGSAWVADGQVRLGGLDLLPTAGGQARLTIDPGRLTVSASGSITVQAGSIPLYHGAVHWGFQAPTSVQIDAGVNLKGFPVKGSADLSLDAEGLKATLHLGLPSIFGGVTGDADLQLTNQAGLRLDTLKVGAKQAQLGPLEAKDISFSYRYQDGGGRWEGAATVGFPTKFPYTIGADVVVDNGNFSSAKAEIAGINKLIGEGIFLQRLRFSVGWDPFSLGGGMGVSAGPAIEGHEAVSLDGDMSYRSGNPSEFTLSGQLKAVEVQLASAEVRYRTSGQLDFKGDLDFERAGFGITASLNGFVDGSRSFNAEGHGQLKAFGHGPEADGVISNKGIAACGHIGVIFGTWDVGFGYYWGGNLDLMEHACDVGPWKASRASARATALGATFVLPRGLPGTVFGITGAGAPPRVSLSGPGGEVVTTPADGSSSFTGREWIIEDTADDTTYLAIGAPAAGTWTVVPQLGSAPITKIQQADGLKAPRVRAQVHRRGHLAILSWHLAPAKGQQVVFYESGGGANGVIASVARSAGRQIFTPAEGQSGARTVYALVLQDGLPRHTVRLATYNAPVPRHPGRPVRLQLRRRQGVLTIDWQGEADVHQYRTRVSLADGRTLVFFTASRRLSVTGLVGKDHSKVTVEGLTVGGASGPAAHARLG
jgi:hypothetical protein